MSHRERSWIIYKGYLESLVTTDHTMHAMKPQQAKEKRHTKNLEEIVFEDYKGQEIVLVPTRQNGKSPNM